MLDLLSGLTADVTPLLCTVNGITGVGGNADEFKKLGIAYEVLYIVAFIINGNS